MSFFRRLSKAKKLALLSILPILGLALCIYLNLTTREYITLWPCVVLEGLGIACPGCGATRAVCEILTFDFLAAIRYNLLVTVLFFIFALYYLYNFYKIARFNKAAKANGKILIAVAAALLLFAVIRNLSFYPWAVAPPA